MRRFTFSALLAYLLAAPVLAAPAAASAEGAKTLFVYGPGGPFTPVRACGERFQRARGIAVKVDGGPEDRWIAKAAKDADLIFSAAEYMLSDFARRHPGLLDPSARESLWVRRAAILVRRGNPKAIRSMHDLAKPGVRILDVTSAGQTGLWEDLAGRHGLIPAVQKNIAASFSNTAEAMAAWRNQPELDAWITFASWQDRMRDDTDVVELPKRDRLYRGTPVAVTLRSRSREEAMAFVAFLRSEECHAVFRQAGWE